MHFLGQVNMENCSLIEGDASVTGAQVSRAELVLWHLSPDMFLPAGDAAFLERAGELLRALPENGRLALCWDNPFSVHAFCGGFRDKGRYAGCPDAGEARLSRANMQGLLDTLVTDAGADVFSGRQIRWFYPYPSAGFVTHIFSDERLPGAGECEDNDYNFEAARLESFDEQRVTESIVAAGLYPQLAHAYLVVISGKDALVLPDFVRFSVQRRETCRIITKLYGDHVDKEAVCAAAKAHVLAMADWKESLDELVRDMTVCGRKLRVNEVTGIHAQEGSVSFAFAPGRSLEEMLDALLSKGEREKVCDTLLEFCDTVRSKADRPFVVTEEFATVFGDCHSACKEWRSLPVTDVDLVCQNILLSDTQATLIDYEWTFAFPVPVDFCVYRFLYLFLEAKNRSPFDRETMLHLYEKAGISESDRLLFERMETSFQQYVQAGGYVLRNAYEQAGRPVLRREELTRQLAAMDEKALDVRYERCFPAGQNAEQTETQDCVLYGSREENGISRFTIPVRGQRMELTLTGYKESPVLLRIGMLRRTRGESLPCTCEVSGTLLGGLVYVFRETPKLCVEELTQEDESLLLAIEEISCSEAAASELEQRVSDLAFLVENREQQLQQMRQSASWRLTEPLRKLRGQ